MASQIKNILASALQYRELGFSVIPVGKDKKPLIKWEPYQSETASPEQIKEWWTKHPDANIAIVTGSISNLAVIDIDTEEGMEAIQEFIPDSLVTPTCTTPRGGQHLYFLCPDDKLTNNSKIVTGCDLRANGGIALAPPSVGANGNQYKWIVDLTNTEIQPLPRKYLEFIKNSNAYSYINNNSLYSNVDNKQIASLNFSEGQRNEDLFHVVNYLAKGGMPYTEAWQVLVIINNNCSPPLPEKELKAIIQSAYKRVERRERNLAQEVREWVLSTNGYFLSTDLYNCLQLSTRDEKKNVHTILRRLCDEGLIEKHGNRNGQYRTLDKEEEVIDIFSENDDPLDIKLPFEIEEYVEIMPRNIVVIAGVSNAGKTAFLLNFAEMNRDKFKIYYFTSEMGDKELKKRLRKFERPYEEWEKVTFIERASNFADVIRPNDINIIDFLELHDDFWKVGGLIKDIYDRLDKGIALIALQKDPQKEYGIGATRSLEKARLYLTMDSHSLKIVKGKNWKQQGVNPNGLVLQFKLVQGCKFIIEQDWRQ